jgi:hypothetical protein
VAQEHRYEAGEALTKNLNLLKNQKTKRLS